MSDTDTTVPRVAADALSDLGALIKAAHDQAIPFSLTRGVELLAEHATLSQHDDVSAVVERVANIEKLLIEAGIGKPADYAALVPAPALAAPGPAL